MTVDPLLSSLQDDLDQQLDADYLASFALAERLVDALTLDALRRVGLWPSPAGSSAESLGALADRLGTPADRQHALAWLLERARAVGHLERGADGAWLLGEPPAADLVARIEATLESPELAERARLLGTSGPLLAHCAARFPEFLVGERSAATILFKGEGLRLWSEYFSAGNGLYEPHNELAARAVAALATDLGRPLRILELGAGSGGGSAAILAALGPDRVAEYVLTDLAPSLLLATQERMAALGLPPTGRRRLDFGRSLVEQGIEPASFDLVVEVNALHNCLDLQASLRWIAEILRPDGALVLSESLCPHDRQVHQDLVFQLFPFHDGADTRSRFDSIEGWRAACATSDAVAADCLANRTGPALAMVAVARPRPG
ncbi:MAG: class I SAM-dependent methyltransferase [Acidobacteriota bacterium]